MRIRLEVVSDYRNRPPGAWLVDLGYLEKYVINEMNMVE
jgi:hypothetical protein